MGAPEAALRTRIGRVDPYDVVPYEARPLAFAHPVRLATAALRRGFRCAPPESCRMLDLGCADATNLLPLALAYPDSEFVGVERSGVQIAAARDDVAKLEIRNLRLVQANVTDLGQDLGRFDYIVAHGLFSWVSHEARAAILRLFAAALETRGIGCLTYNAQPGWGPRAAVREVLRRHTRSTPDPRDKITRAREHIGRLRSVLGDVRTEPFTAQLAQILEPLASRSDSYLLHEFLCEHNEAFTLDQVVESLGAHDLSVLGELGCPTSTFAAQESLESALRAADVSPAEVEGVVDLVTCRTFRASLVCREAERPSMSDPPATEGWLPGCEVALATRPVDAREVSSAPASPSVHACATSRLDATETERTPDAWLRVALAALAEVWPGSIGVDALLTRTKVPADARASALRDVLRASDLGYFELRSHALQVAAAESQRPAVSPLTRLDASRGRWVTNQLHESVTLSEQVARVATLLDGTRRLHEIAGLFGENDNRAPGTTGGAAQAVRLLAAQALLVS